MTVGPRSYTDATIKKLFALSYNVCGFPGCERRLYEPGWERVGADICHIYGAEGDAPRFDESVPVDFLRSYENLLLLCKSCHHHIDYERPSDFPVNLLFEIKKASERPREPALDQQLVREFMSALSLSVNIEPALRNVPVRSIRRWEPLIAEVESKLLEPGSVVHRPTARALLEAEYAGDDFEYLEAKDIDDDDLQVVTRQLRQAQAIGYADRPYLHDDDRTLAELNAEDAQSEG
jgi:hypothetical protein